jgi:peroxiredoxin
MRATTKMKAFFRAVHAARLAAFAALLAARAMAGGTLQSLPEFSLKDLDGKTWTRASLAGRPVVVDFWATWCVTCRQSIPTLAGLNDKLKGKGLTMIGVSVDKGSAEKVAKAAKKMGINYTVLLDNANTLAPAFGFDGIPSVYVFDRRGRVQAALPGYDPDQEDKLVAAAEKAVH